MSIVELAAQSGKWSKPAMTHTVEFFHSRIRELVAQKLAESGRRWEEVVDDPDFELSLEDFERLDAELLETGYRYEMSAQISLTEAPDKYRAATQLADTGADSRDEAGPTGRRLRGVTCSGRLRTWSGRQGSSAPSRPSWRCSSMECPRTRSRSSTTPVAR